MTKKLGVIHRWFPDRGGGMGFIRDGQTDYRGQRPIPVISYGARKLPLESCVAWTPIGVTRYCPVRLDRTGFKTLAMPCQCRCAQFVNDPRINPKAADDEPQGRQHHADPLPPTQAHRHLQGRGILVDVRWGHATFRKRPRAILRVPPRRRMMEHFFPDPDDPKMTNFTRAFVRKCINHAVTS
jgi:hypothetical protein